MVNEGYCLMRLVCEIPLSANLSGITSTIHGLSISPFPNPKPYSNFSYSDFVVIK